MKDIVIMEESVVVLELNDEYDGENLIYHEKIIKNKNKRVNAKLVRLSKKTKN